MAEDKPAVLEAGDTRKGPKLGKSWRWQNLDLRKDPPWATEGKDRGNNLRPKRPVLLWLDCLGPGIHLPA